ncbi:2-C-methyl-D-erythritol 4-phosphate cytidylyltransferase [Patescibacteria group bacterium]|nr:2-C-methyl-D-erythritol 4-phosphate cytidylyltransferase [Patescibacteria group bacterium]
MISAVITAAGNCTRFGKEKLFSLIDKEPVFIRTVKQFKKVKEVDEIVLVVRKDTRKKFEKWLKKFKLKVKTVEGGAERLDSAHNGVKASQGDYILIHDGARPLVSPALIKKVAEAAKKYGAAMAAYETTTCVKLINQQTMEVEQCLDRNKSWLGQTPQGFKKEIILKAYQMAVKGKIKGMDDCELVRKTGKKVKVVPGEWINKKITIPVDLEIIRKWIKYV